jgi:hypothetical protein
MVRSLSVGLLSSFLTISIAWALALLAAHTWLKHHPTPIRRAAWVLFLVLTIRIVFNPFQFFAVGLLSIDIHPPSRAVLTTTRLALTGLIWAVGTKIFFRKASAAQVLLTALLGVGEDALLVTGMYARLIHGTGLLGGA